MSHGAPTASQPPTVGRIVHVYDRGASTPLAAIVTAVFENDFLSATAFLPNGGTRAFLNIMQGSGPRNSGACWCWPPRS